ncbi:hypothetical protein OHT93_03715 [Streptomyces sp. NBC_00191]|uniref:hypothetical protein n=1 Tax=Streptomyces sp. NBC_00191 TaxID=2975674 RepID=UPI00324DE1F0
MTAHHCDARGSGWLVSAHAHPVTVKPVTADGTRLVDVLDKADVTNSCSLASYGVRVLRHEPASSP